MSDAYNKNNKSNDYMNQEKCNNGKNQDNSDTKSKDFAVTVRFIII